ncbi:MAG: fumarylacetoacetate hydrolase family protein [Moraxella sp.]|nr:fumarylacetoacetate hydrolase family protein [Moraxella sp.]
MTRSVRTTDQQTHTVNTIFCIGRSYAEHIRELGNATPNEPLVFLKPNSSLTTGDTLTLPSFSSNIHHEVEAVLLMGDNRSIDGIAVGLDLTARDIQDIAKSHGLPWTKAKGFKNACWVGNFRPYQSAAYELFLSVNGEVRQHDTITKMMYSFEELVNHLDELYGLSAGDLIFTGTPKGVGQLVAGDTLIAKLDDDEYQLSVV